MIDNWKKHGAFGRYGKSYQMVDKEKGYGGKLSLLGKLTYFCEWFEDVKITEEDIMSLVPLEKPMDTLSFKDGYNRAVALVKNGFAENDYYVFLNSLRHKEMLELIIIKRTGKNNINKLR